MPNTPMHSTRLMPPCKRRFLFQHGIRGRVPDSVLMNAINNNPLGLFIAANLLTGVVNLLFPTLLMDVVSATTILVVYLVILTSFAYILSVYRIKIA